MKKLKLFFALFAMLALGVGNAWGAETLYKNALFKIANCTNNSSYTGKVTCTIGGDSWVAQNAANNNGGWDYVKIGAKKSKASDPTKVTTGTITTNAAYAEAVSKIVVNGKQDRGSFTSKLIIASNSSFATDKVEIAGATSFTNNQIIFEIASPSANKYYKLEFVCSNTTTTNGVIQVSSVEYYYEPSSEETAYSVTLNQPAEGGSIGADKDEAAKGATVTLTATPDEGYKFGAWTVTGASGNVAVTNNQFTMPAEDVTVTASFIAKTQYTIKWNVAEGSVADTKVYEGEALGSLPTAEICSSGKVFVGWTEATSVNPDGSGITYVKATDIPNGNKEYNAVYAVSGGTEDKVDELTQSWTGITGTTYTAWSDKKSNTSAIYSGQSAAGNDAIQLRATSPSGIITTTSGGKLKKVVVTWNSNTTSGRTLNVYGKNTAYTSTSELYEDATAGTKIGTIVEGTSTTLEITDEYEYIGMRSNSGAMYLDEIEITWSSTSYTDYSLDCEAHQDPFLTVDEAPINFGTVAQDATVTETLNVSGGYLAEDVALTISGTDASYFSVNPTTITKADEIDQDVTISYNPTATGEHTATLTIKSGEITKTVALSGTVLAPGKWTLVKNVAELSAGDEVIIASSISNYAIGTVASSNYKGAAITKVGETANADASVTVLTVEETGVAEAPFAFKTDGKYLYAASSSANQLKAQETNNANGQWAVTITEGVASIVAAKSSNRKVMQYNPNNGSPIFACYASASSSYEPLAIYRNSENVAKPVISGEVNFVGSTQVTITAQSGLTVYYTTNGSDPDNTSTQYTAPFTINATTTVKAIAYDASSNASAVAEMTFTKQELVNVATAMALAKDEIAYFDEFEVVKVVAGKGNIYIKDASGHGLIYDFTLAGKLKDGDRVQGFVGVSSPYNGLPEAKPYNVTYADLTITAGTLAEPYDFTSTAIAETDINKYIVFQNVEIAENTDMSTSPTLTIGGNSVKFYNQFGVSKTLEADKIYDIYGFVAVYEKDGNRTLQVYFYEALQDGEVVQKYTVTYNAGGATGTVPVDNAEYSEGAEVYLKSATTLTYEGYEYKGWKVTDEGGNEIAVTSNKFNMPASNVTVTAQWEEIVVTPRQDFSEGYWVLVSSASELTAGDKIMITAAEENFAMKSYESGNNCGQIEITKLGEGKFVKWISEVGVFELAANGSNYTIQDVNTEEYLYAAGTGDKNYLKATDEVPSDAAAAKPYIWTISYTDGVATVKATSDNHNDLQYNKSADLFSCYASTQGKIALYKHVDNIDPTLVTPSVESGIFSVGNGKFVQFSTGNLQYEVGTNTWSFASEQYEVIGGEAYTGSNNTNYGMNEPGYTGKLDLFAWSCDGKFGVNPSNADADYTGEFADWGNLVNETGWYTLTKDEMTYILNRKKDGKKLWALATVCGMNGLILLPDNWNTSTTLEYGYIPADWNYTKNQLDAAAWATLEAAGAVFLPEGGTRVGGHGNKIGFDGETVEIDATKLDASGDYFHVDNVGEMGYYWLNSTTSEKADYLILPGWSDNGTPTDASDDKALAPQVWSREKRRGNSVRLVKEVTPDYTRAVTPGNLGTICLPSNVPAGKASGATFYTLAGMDANDRVAFDEVTSELEAGKSYLFQANAAEIVCYYGTTSVLSPDDTGAMKGTFEDMTLDGSDLTNIYYFAKNALWSCEGDTELSVPANRAYVNMAEVTTITEPAPVGVRRITLGVNGAQVATGVDQVQGDEVPTKMIINGQLFILRGEKMYDAQGKLVK